MRKTNKENIKKIKGVFRFESLEKGLFFFIFAFNLAIALKNKIKSLIFNKNKIKNNSAIFKPMALLTLILLMASFAFAVPNTLTFSGKLTDASGNDLTGTYSFNYSIYDSYVNGTLLWNKTNISVTTDSDGIYDVVLEDVNLNFSDQYYVGLSVGSDSEMTPRTNLTSVPYTFRANISDSVKDESVSNLSIDSTDDFSFNNIFFSKAYGDNISITGNLSVSGNMSVDGSTLFVDATGNRVGIGTTSPSYLLQIANASKAANLSNTLFVNGSSGRVGIGTTSPDNNAKLHIKGNSSEMLAVLENTGGTSILKIITGTTEDPFIMLQANSGSWWSMGVDQDDSEKFQIAQYSALGMSNQYFTIQTNGNVGIGQTSPNVTLGVSGDVNVTGTLYLGSGFAQAEADGWKKANFTVAYDVRKDRWNGTNFTVAYGTEYDSTGYKEGNLSSDLSAGVASTIVTTDITADTILVNKNLYVVGNISNVNVTNLNVNGSLYPAITATFDIGNGSLRWRNANFSGTVEAAYFVGDGSKLTSVQQGADIWKLSNFTGAYGTEYDSTGFDRENLTLYLGADGNASLLRTGNISKILEDIWDWSNNASLVLDNGTVIRTGNLSTIFSERNGSLWNITASEIMPRDNNLNVSVNTSVFFVDTTNERVGIGTTSPSAKLQVESGDVQFNGSDDDIGFFWDDSSGRLGLGDETPTFKLDMVDSVSTFIRAKSTGSFGGIILERASNRNNSYVMHKTSGADLDPADWYAGEIGSLGDGYGYTISNGLTSANSKLYIANSTGNVGIGTTAPSKRLEVVGNVSLNLSDDSKDFEIFNGSGTSIFFVDGENKRVGIGQASPNVTLGVSGDVNITGILHADSANITNTIEATTFIGDGSSLTGISTGQIWNSSGTNVFLNDTAAKVGIGKINPGQELHVVGSANISATLNAPVINTTLANQNITISSAGGSVIIRLG